MIKLIGCLDKRLQGQQINSAAIATELSHHFFPVVKCPYCGKKRMRCVLKSSSRQNKEISAGGWMKSVVVFPQYSFFCESCSAHKYVLLTTDLEIDHSPFTMDSIFSMMHEKIVCHHTNRDLEDKYGMCRATFMKWNQKFSHDYHLLKTFLPTHAKDEDVLTGRVPLSHAMTLFFISFGRFFLHPPNDFSIIILPTNMCIQNFSIEKSFR